MIAEREKIDLLMVLVIYGKLLINIFVAEMVVPLTLFGIILKNSKRLYISINF